MKPFSAIAPFLTVMVLALFFLPASVRSDCDHNVSAAIRLFSDESTVDGGNDVCGSFSQSNSLSCPINCFRADPVCGVNGVTYWCGCPEASCAGVKVAKKGYCEVGSGGSVPLPGQALLLVHIIWLFLLAFSLLLGLF